jgi:proteasome accessory factor C
MSAQPANTAGAQVMRLLALVPYALTRREVPLAQASADLGIPIRQIINDLKVLMFCGWPGYLPGDYIEVDLDALEGEGVIRVTNADYLARPLRLTVAEASALIVALRTLRDSADADVVPVVDRTLKKLEAAAEDGAVAAERVDVRLGEREKALGRRRTQLTHALDAGRQVLLGYYVPARDEKTERVVDPLDLVSDQGMSYLDAWCHRAEDRRLFRLDRIESVTVLDTAAEAHPDIEPRDLSAGIFQPAQGDVEARIRLSPRARWVAEYYPVAVVDEAADGALEVTLRVGNPQWLQRLLLRLAPDAVVLEPTEYADRHLAAARAALKLYAAAYDG